jgi:F0F1-type ATP synthase epsilon subunit
MSTLAKNFGISDVGLAKRCRAVDVPIPYRGYWARKEAGHNPPKLPLPKYRTKAPKPEVRDGEEPAVPFTLSMDPVKRPAHEAPGMAADEQALQERLAGLNIAPVTHLAETCATVRRTAKHEKLPGRAELPLTAAERPGLIVHLHVSKDTLPRALLLADRFIKTAEAVGWPLTDPAPPDPSAQHQGWEQQGSPQPAPDSTRTAPTARLLVDGEPIGFLIEERYREEAREPTARELARERRDYSYRAPRVTKIATGALRVVRIDSTCRWSPRRRSWYDQGVNLVEHKILKILAAFYERAQEIKAKRAEDERRQREWAEQERLRKENEDRRDAHAKLRAELERQAGAWHRSQFLRRYIRAARRSVGHRLIERPFLNQPIDFLEWAENYVDQLDPLTAIQHNRDQWPEPSDHAYADEVALKKLLLRVSGFDGLIAQKLDNFDLDAGHADDSSDDDDDD